MSLIARVGGHKRAMQASDLFEFGAAGAGADVDEASDPARPDAIELPEPAPRYAWHVRDPRGFNAVPTHARPLGAPGTSTLGFTTLFIYPGARQALFDAAPGAAATRVRAPVTAMLAMLGVPDAAVYAGFASNSRAVPESQKPFGPLSAVYDLRAVREPCALAPYDPPFEVRSAAAIWPLMTAVDRAVRAECLARRLLGESAADRAELHALLSALGAPLSARTMDLAGLRVAQGAVDLSVSVRARGLLVKEQDALPRDWFFAERAGSGSLVSDALAGLLAYASRAPARQRIAGFGRGAAPELVAFFKPANETTRTNDDVLPGALDVDVTRDTTCPRDATGRRMQLLALRPQTPVGTPGADVPPTLSLVVNVPRTASAILAVDTLPIWMFVDCVTRLVEPECALKDWMHVFARFSDWYALLAHPPAERRPPSFMYLMPTALVRALAWHGRGPLRALAADCVLALALAECLVCPSAAAYAVASDACDAFAALDGFEDTSAFFLPPAMVAPSAALAVERLRAFAHELGAAAAESGDGVDEARLAFAWHAAAAFASEHLPAPWRGAVEAALAGLPRAAVVVGAPFSGRMPRGAPAGAEAERVAAYVARWPGAPAWNITDVVRFAAGSAFLHTVRSADVRFAYSLALTAVPHADAERMYDRNPYADPDDDNPWGVPAPDEPGEPGEPGERDEQACAPLPMRPLPRELAAPRTPTTPTTPEPREPREPREADPEGRRLEAQWRGMFGAALLPTELVDEPGESDGADEADDAYWAAVLGEQ